MGPGRVRIRALRLFHLTLPGSRDHCTVWIDLRQKELRSSRLYSTNPALALETSQSFSRWLLELLDMVLMTRFGKPMLSWQQTTKIRTWPSQRMKSTCLVSREGHIPFAL